MSGQPHTGIVKWPWLHANKQQSGAADNVELIAAPGAGIAIVIHQIIVTTSAAATSVQVTEGDDAAGTRLIDVYSPADGGIYQEWPIEFPYELPANTALKLTTGGNNAKVMVHYWLQDTSL